MRKAPGASPFQPGLVVCLIGDKYTSQEPEHICLMPSIPQVGTRILIEVSDTLKKEFTVKDVIALSTKTQLQSPEEHPDVAVSVANSFYLVVEERNVSA